MPTIAWMSWIALVMAVALVTTNPLYLAIVFLSVVLVGVLAPKTNTGIAGIRADPVIAPLPSALVDAIRIGLPAVRHVTKTVSLGVKPLPVNVSGPPGHCADGFTVSVAVSAIRAKL